MKNVKHILLLSVTGLLMACSENAFQSLPTESCNAANSTSGQSCVSTTKKNTYTFTIHTGDVDILIVDDNSGSMYNEQQKMDQAMGAFLGSISNLNYQLAIITTDVSSASNPPRPPLVDTFGNMISPNGNGAFQDGKFLDFSSGEKILKKTAADFSIKFSNTIRRKESVDCGNNGYQTKYCPSGDERGIYALNLAATRNEGKFFRTGAHLAVIILSDEDERSTGGGNGALETLDYPSSFMTTMQTLYPSKTVSVHSVVIRDEACRNDPSQTYTTSLGGLVRGSIGNNYMSLSGLTTYGQVGSICDSNYTSQMGDIGAAVGQAATQPEFQLDCNPQAGDVVIKDINTGAILNLSYTVNSSNKMIFSNVPAGTDAKITVACQK